MNAIEENKKIDRFSFYLYIRNSSQIILNINFEKSLMSLIVFIDNFAAH